MANVYGSLGVILRDGSGVQGSHELIVQIADTTTLAQLAADVAAYSVVLNNLTALEGVNAWVRLNFATTGLRTSPLDTTRFGDGALFSFGKTGMSGKVSIMVPGLQTNCLTGGAPSPDETDTAAWISWIQANGTHFQVVTREHVVPSGFLECRLNDRDSRKALTKKTTRKQT